MSWISRLRTGYALTVQTSDFIENKSWCGISTYLVPCSNMLYYWLRNVGWQFFTMSPHSISCLKCAYNVMLLINTGNLSDICRTWLRWVGPSNYGGSPHCPVWRCTFRSSICRPVSHAKRQHSGSVHQLSLPSSSCWAGLFQPNSASLSGFLPELVCPTYLVLRWPMLPTM